MMMQGTVSTILGIVASSLFPIAAQASGDVALAIPTFPCLGIYCSPPNGSADRPVQVRYRQQGQPQWKEALPRRYNPIPRTDLDLADYRGSIAHLLPGTSYEVQLTLAGTSATKTLPAPHATSTLKGGE